VQAGHDLILLNRGRSPKHPAPAGAHTWIADIRGDRETIAHLLADRHFDAVVDFVAFVPEDIVCDIELLRDKTDQFVFISSASAYQKPPRNYLITETTRLENPYWSYSQGKIACEKRLMAEYAESGFPATIVRPSLTYGPSQIPFSVGSWQHPWTVIDRMRRGRKIVIPGDGTSLWVLTWNADFAQGLVGLLGRPETFGETYHITSDEVLSWNQIYLEAFEALGVEPHVVHVPSELIAAYWPHAAGSLLGDKMHSAVFNNSKIKAAVPGFNCRVSWAAGLRRALDWHAAHPQYQTVDPEFDHILDQIVLASDGAYPPA
jgi:nucleoside-diphosphate-sugar epimerase